MKLLVGLYQPQAGRILYNGVAGSRHRPRRPARADRLRHPGHAALLRHDPREPAVREARRRPTPSASTCCGKAACDSLLARADRGLDTVIGEGGVKVSGGEKQRLSIARALLRRPHLLVFDEATSSLDSLTEEEIVDTIRDVATSGDVITVLIAHRLSTVLHADRIYVLERGRIVETGRHDELRRAEGALLRDVAAADRRAARPRGHAARRSRSSWLIVSLTGYEAYFFSQATVIGHACSVAFKLAPSLPPCARRNPCPAPSKMCGS